MFVLLDELFFLGHDGGYIYLLHLPQSGLGLFCNGYVCISRESAHLIC